MDNDTIRQHIQTVLGALKQCEALGLELLQAEKGHVQLLLPYSEKLIGNMETRVINGGAITTLMDTVCAFAAVSALDEPSIAPTLDLRIDYMGRAIPDTDLIGKAEAYRVTRHVIFARGQAFHPDEPDRPFAHCTATFMRLSADTIKGDTRKMLGGH